MTGRRGTAGPAAPAAAPFAVAAPTVVDMARARSAIADVRTGRSTWARAAPALGLRPEDLPADREARALEIYRAYVGGIVGAASPLAARACALARLDLDKLTHCLRPGGVWEQWLCGVRPRDAWLRSLTGQVNAPDATPDMRREWALREWLHPGVVVRDADRRLAMVGVRVLDDVLEVAASLGGHRLRTYGGEGSITLRLELPATVLAALPGVALDRFVDHPLIAGAGCVVTGVDERTMWGTKVRFSLAPVPWRLPWAR